MNKAFSLARLLLRFSLGLGFVFPVLDRLGVLGAPGSRNVSWGNWHNFITYTRRMTPYASERLGNVMGGLATIGEAAFGVMLIAGVWVRIAAYGSFLLTLAFALSMLFFLGYRAPFDYSVFVVSFSSLLLGLIYENERSAAAQSLDTNTFKP